MHGSKVLTLAEYYADVMLTITAYTQACTNFQHGVQKLTLCKPLFPARTEVPARAYATLIPT